MISFSHEPPEDPRGFGLDLLRTPKARPLKAAVTCVRLVGCPTHFWGGRTVPCDNAKCEACDHGAPWRWHGYISAMELKTQQHFLFEMTARAAEPFKVWFAKHATLRGCQFEATRRQQKSNGRVDIRVGSIDLLTVQIPDPPDVYSILSVIWNIPLDSIMPGPQIKDHASAHVQRGKAEYMALAEQRAKANGETPSPKPAQLPRVPADR